MNTPLTNDELLDLGINIAWVPQPTHLVTYVALHDYVKDFMERGSVAYQTSVKPTRTTLTLAAS